MKSTMPSKRPSNLGTTLHLHDHEDYSAGLGFVGKPLKSSESKSM
ncbi:Uncharacterised protein [Vibrio cholerae]|nr:Uncharacterised protein [Vibrio cholerae]